MAGGKVVFPGAIKLLGEAGSAISQSPCGGTRSPYQNQLEEGPLLPRAYKASHGLVISEHGSLRI